MKSIGKTLKQIGDALAGLSIPVYHYWRPNMTAPYVVWTESGSNPAYAGNLVAEQALTGAVHLFTQTEYDPVVDEVQAILAQLRCVWTLESVQFEEDTELIHYEWSWEML